MLFKIECVCAITLFPPPPTTVIRLSAHHLRPSLSLNSLRRTIRGMQSQSLTVGGIKASDSLSLKLAHHSLIDSKRKELDEEGLVFSQMFYGHIHRMCCFTGSATVVRCPWSKLVLHKQGHRAVFHLVGSRIRTNDLSVPGPTL